MCHTVAPGDMFRFFIYPISLFLLNLTNTLLLPEILTRAPNGAKSVTENSPQKYTISSFYVMFDENYNDQLF